MTATLDLDAARRDIRVRRRRIQMVEDRRKAALAGPAPAHQGLTLRCTKSHRGGKVPKVAEVHQTSFGTFFVARIPWARSDASVLRPWTEADYLPSLFADDAHLDNDELLRNALTNLNFWRENGPGDLSWIADRGGRDHTVIDVLDLPDTTGRMPLWVRCPHHLEDFETVEPGLLLKKLR